MFEINEFYSDIEFKGFEDNVNMAGTDTVCNDGSWGEKEGRGQYYLNIYLVTMTTADNFWPKHWDSC